MTPELCLIEGFFGRPWSWDERRDAVRFLAPHGYGSYLYAPKDDLKHRALWRETYSPVEAEAMRELIHACKTRGLRFIYALSPGLDIRFSQDSELACLQARFEQMLQLGCGDFALLFDDIPDRMHAEDRERWGSFASAQCHVTNAMFHWTRELLARQIQAELGEMSAERLKWEVARRMYGVDPAAQTLIDRKLADVSR